MKLGVNSRQGPPDELGLTAEITTLIHIMS